jgi:transcriptional regulator with XRE-family HTH domain
MADGKAALGRRIRELRAAAGLSQQALAKAVGVAQGRVSDWENGRAPPKATALPALATALGVTIGELFEPAPAKKRRARK